MTKRPTIIDVARQAGVIGEYSIKALERLFEGETTISKQKLECELVERGSVLQRLRLKNLARSI